MPSVQSIHMNSTYYNESFMWSLFGEQ